MRACVCRGPGLTRGELMVPTCCSRVNCACLSSAACGMLDSDAPLFPTHRRERDGQWGENETLVVGAHLNCSPHSMHSSLVGRCTGQLASSYSLARYITAMLVMPYHTVLESHLDQNLTHSTGACSHLTHFFFVRWRATPPFSHLPPHLHQLP